MHKQSSSAIHALAKVRARLRYAPRDRAMTLDLAPPRSLSRIIGKAQFEPMTSRSRSTGWSTHSPNR